MSSTPSVAANLSNDARRGLAILSLSKAANAQLDTAASVSSRLLQLSVDPIVANEKANTQCSPPISLTPQHPQKTSHAGGT